MPVQVAPTSLDELAAAVGVAAAADCWRRHWPAFERWSASAEPVRWTVPDASASVFDLSPDVLPPLSAAMGRIEADPALSRLGSLWHFLVYHLDGEIGDNSNGWPLPAALGGVPNRLFGLAVLVSGTRHAAANMAASGMPPDVCAASLALIGHRVREVRQKRHAWGVESLSFLRHYVRAELFRLGRLTFRASPFPWPFHVYRSRRNGELGVHGDGPEWAEVVGPGDLRVEVHVPGGTPLDPAACAASYRDALAVFPGRHPGRPPAGFTCVSWLLDPALRKLPVPPRNILRFAEPFRLLPPVGDHRQAYDLIFGDPDADPARAPLRTSLQGGIAAHVAAGGSIRAMTGFIPWDEAAARLAAPDR